MNPEQLFRAIGQIEDTYVERADAAKKESRLPNRAPTWAALAASVLLVCMAGAILWLYRGNGTAPPSAHGHQPQILLEEENLFGGGYGGECHWAVDIADLKSANPWTEHTPIKTLPVFQNPIVYAEDGTALAPDLAAMKQRLLETAERLGISADETQVRDNYPDKGTREKIAEKHAWIGDTVPADFFRVTMVFLESGGVRIEVDSSLVTTVLFEPARALPGKYDLSEAASYRAREKTVQYIARAHRKLLAMDRPQAAVSGVGRDVYGKPLYETAVFDGGGSLEERIVSYNFNFAQVAWQEGKGLTLIRLYQPDLSRKLGDYPIISVERAHALLAEGKYGSTSGEAFPGKELIGKTELIYNMRPGNKVWLPYYRVYAQLPEKAQEDVAARTYAAFYVPAVEESYLSETTVWNGPFEGMGK